MSANHLPRAFAAPSRPTVFVRSGFLSLLLMLLASMPAVAAEWFAAPDGGGSACTEAAPCTIQGAIDKAAPYDTVRVKPGDYSFTSNRIRIETEGLRLIGETSPFAKPYATPPGPGEVAHGELDNKAADAVVLKAASENAPSGGASGMIWVRNVKDVRIENLYIEVNSVCSGLGCFLGSGTARAKEGIVASGHVNGLELVNNYIRFTGGTSAIGIGINVAGTTDSSVPSGETRQNGQFVTLEGNVLEPTGASGVAKRAIAIQGNAGIIRGNQVAGHTQDMWITSPSTAASNPHGQRVFVVEDNWFFGRLGLYLAGGSGFVEPTRIRGNHFVLSVASGDDTENHQLRLMSASAPGTIVEGNRFTGFRNNYAALWIQNRADVTIRNNIFTPEPGQSDFRAIVLGNRMVQSGNPNTPLAYGATILGNTFNANGAPGNNKAKAILLVNDNDPNGAAPAATVQVGDGTAAGANTFDAGIGWYIALDDRSCYHRNHATTSGSCQGSSSYAIGAGINYSAGSPNGSGDARGQKRPFKWDVTAAGNTFGGIAMADMDEAQYNAVLARTYAAHNAVTAPAETGSVVYDWTPPPPPPQVELTITNPHSEAPANDHKTGSVQTFGLAAVNHGGDGTVRGRITVRRTDGAVIPMVGQGAEDGDALAVWTAGNLAPLVPADDGKSVSLVWPDFDVPLAAGDGLPEQPVTVLFRVPGAYRVLAEIFDAADPAVTYGDTSFDYAVTQDLAVSFTGTNPVAWTGSPLPLAFEVSPQSNPAVADLSSKVALTYNGGTDAPVHGGSYAVHAISADSDYVIAPAASTEYVIERATGTVQWGALNFDYDGQAHAVSATIAETGEACVVMPTSVGPDVGQYPVSASCAGATMDASATATATVGGASAVHVRETGNWYANVADALADAATLDGHTVELAPGNYPGPVTLTKGVKLVGGVTVQDGGTRILAAGPLNPPATVIDGGNAAASGIIIANGVTGAAVSGLEIRNFTQDCVVASQGNHGLLIEESHVHHCGRRGIFVNGVAGIDAVVLRNNHVSDTGDRGISIWNGAKRDITVTDNLVTNAGTTAIAFDDGIAAGITVVGNEIVDSGDTGISVLQPGFGSLATPANRNHIALNTVSNPGRFGITLMIPNGSGADTGDGAIVVEDNIITGGSNLGGSPTDRAGISVVRRYWSPTQGQEDVTQGVIVRGNQVAGFDQSSPGHEAYGIVVEGVGSSVHGNTLHGNQIGLQIQQGNPSGTLPPGDSAVDAADVSDWFDRGNAPLTCVGLGDNAFDDNEVETRFQQPAGSTDTMLGGIYNETADSWHCTIGAAITAASAGDTLRAVAGTYAENVVIGKSLTLKGPHAGVHGNDASRDSGEAVLEGTVKVHAADTAMDGWTIARGPSPAIAQRGGDGFQLRNNRLLDLDGDAVAVTSSSGWHIEGNLFRDIGGHAVRPHGGTNTGMVVRDNDFRAVGAAVQMIKNQDAVVTGNRVHRTTNYAVQVADSDSVSVRDNVIREADLGVLLDRNNTRVAILCNDIEGTQFGLIAMDHIAPGGQSMHILHNRIVAPLHVRTNWTAAETLVLGANFYDGSAPATGAPNGGQLEVADPLAANPIGDPACGDNSPVSIVAHPGTGTQSTPVHTPFSDLGVRVQDALGGAVMGEAVSLVAGVSEEGASALLGSTSGLTDYNGEFVTTATANGIAGSYPVTASSGSLADVAFSLTNTIGSATVSVTGGSVAFDGQPHAVTVTTDPPGLEGDVHVVYTDIATSATAATCVATDAACGPVAPGSYNAVATISGNPNYSGTGSGTLSITDTSSIGLMVSGPARVEADQMDDGYLATLANDGGMSPQAVFLRLTLARSSGEAVEAGDVEVCIPDPNQPIAYGVCGAGEVWLGNKTVVTTPAGPAVQVRYPQLSQNEIEIPGNLPPVAFPARVQLAAGDWHVVAEVVSSDGTIVYARDSHDVQSRIATTINLADLVQAYDGTPKSASVTTHPAGVDVDVTYDNGPAPTAVGSYALVARVNQLYHDGADATGTFEITRGAATVTLSHLVQPHDGTPKSVVVDTVPAGLPVSITYDGNPTPPTAVGTYDVVATVNDPNYTGVASGTLQIVASTGDIALVLNGPVDPVQVGEKADYAATMLANPALHEGQTFGYRLRLTKSGGLPLDVDDLASMEVFFGGGWVDAGDALGSLPFQMVDGALVYDFPDGFGYAGGFPIEDASWTWNVRFSFATEGTYTTTATLIDGIGGNPVEPDVTATIATVVVAASAPADAHLVLGGPVAAEVGQWAEYTGTLIADPALHQSETFFVKVRLAKAGGVMTAADFDAMQIHLGGGWVDGGDLGVVFAQDGDELVYLFPESQMPGGFPIEDERWSWNLRFQYANPGVFTATAELIPAFQAGLANPEVLAADAISTHVQPASVSPPATHLVLLGPVEPVQAQQPVTYTGTLVADPVALAGQQFLVRVRLSKSGAAMQPAHLARMELYSGGWIDATTDIHGVLLPDGDDLLYYFPQPVAGAFPIEDAVWSWHFRFTYAEAGEYHASADLIDASELPLELAAPVAHAAVSTTVVPEASNLSLQLNGPVAGVETGTPAAYTGRLQNHGTDLAEDAYVKVRVELDGETLQAGDLIAEVWTGGAWEAGHFTEVAGGLEADFPDSDGFPIAAGFDWTHQFRITYLRTGLFQATASVVGAVSGDTHAVAAMATAVVATPQIDIDLQGPVVGEVGQPLRYSGSIDADPLPDASERFLVAIRLSKNGGADPMTAADLTRLEISLDGVDWDDYTGQLPLVQSGNDLVYDFPQPLLPNGFPITGAWSWQFRFTYADAATYRAEAQVVTADGQRTPKSRVATVQTMLFEQTPEIALSLQGPLSGIGVGEPAHYAGTLTAAPLPDASEEFIVRVRLGKDGGAVPMTVADLASAAFSDDGSSWIERSDVLDAIRIDPDDANYLVYDFPNPDLASFPITSPAWSWHFQFTYASPGTYSAEATVLRAGSGEAVSNTAGVATAVGLGSAHIAIDPASLFVTYDGNPKSAAVTTTPAGLAYSLSYDGTGTPPTAAGSYAVTATVTQPGYAGTASATMVIARAAGTVSLAPLSGTYGSNHAVTASLDQDPAAHCSVEGVPGPAAAAGSYLVSARCVGANHAAHGSATYVVTPAGTSGITLAGGSFTYTGAAHAAVVANPGGVAYTLGYDTADGLPPVDAGSWTATLTVTDPNYAAEVLTATIGIVPADVALSFAHLAHVYDGSAKGVTVTTSPDGVAGVSLAYAPDAAPVNAGSYTVTASLANPNYRLTGPTTATLEIARATGTVRFDGPTTVPFDGSAHALAASLVQDPDASCTLAAGGDHPRTNAGSTTLEASCEGANHVATASTTLTVAPKAVAIALTGLGEFPYDGQPRVASAEVPDAVAGFPAATVVRYNGASTVPVEVGSYTVVAELAAAGGNYTAAPATGLIVIGAANATVTLADLAATYDGTPHAVSVSTEPAGLDYSLTYDGSAQAPVDAGSYSVVATITEPGYSGSASATLVISRAQATVTLGDLSQSWDGDPKPVSVTTMPADLAVNVLYDGVSAVPDAVGSYAVLATVTDANHTGSASGTLVIGAGGASELLIHGDASFTGIAGQPLAGALPTVKVTDAGGNPVAGVAVSFSAAAGHGTLTGASQVTDSEGLATLGGWILAAEPGESQLSASASGVAGSVQFTALGEAGEGVVSVTLGNGRDYARFGQSLSWTATVGNADSANQAGVRVSMEIPAELDPSSVRWQCIAINGATCEAAGSGDLVDTVTLPAGSSVVYLLSGQVTRSGGDEVELTLSAEAAGGTASATDRTILVLLRDGFEGGDGAQAQPLPPAGHLAPGGALDLAVPAVGLVPEVIASGGGFHIEAVRVDDTSWLRLVIAAADGEQATGWSRHEGGGLRLAFEDGHLILAGTDQTLSLPHGSTGLEVRAPGH